MSCSYPTALDFHWDRHGVGLGRVYRRDGDALSRPVGPLDLRCRVVVVFFVAETVGGHPVVGVVTAVAMLVVAWLLSPALCPASVDIDVARRRADFGEAPLVFWKPGCTFCILLRVRMGASGSKVSWVDSSVNEAARAVVRSLNNGDHTTPTVMFRDEHRTNPDAAWVRSLMR